MKLDRPVLTIAITISILVEIVLVALVYEKVGSARILFQLPRLIIQIFLIFLIFSTKSRIALFMLAGYHVFTAIFNFTNQSLQDWMQWCFLIYHSVLAILIYFHDWIEEKLKPAQDN